KKSQFRPILGTLLLLGLIVFLSGCLGSRGEPVDPYLEFVSLGFSRDSIGTPQPVVTVRNVSSTTVDAFEIKVLAYDDYGRRLKAFGFGDGTYYGISQADIAPGQSYTARWSMYGYETATRLEVTIYSILPVDGRKWS